MHIDSLLRDPSQDFVLQNPASEGIGNPLLQDPNYTTETSLRSDLSLSSRKNMVGQGMLGILSLTAQPRKILCKPPLPNPFQ